MSVSIFSTSELSQIAKKVYQELGEFTFSYQERQVAKQESLNEHETRDDLDILLEEYRWFWESISLANQLEALQTYSKYGESEPITHNKIEVIGDVSFITLRELHVKLGLLQYNSSKFLNHEISEKLADFKEQIGQRLLQSMEIKA